MDWEVVIICPSCQKETELKRCFYSARGEYTFNAYCSNCSQMLCWRVTGEVMAYMAKCADEKVSGQEPRKLPYLLCNLTYEDIQIMKKWRIKP